MDYICIKDKLFLMRLFHIRQTFLFIGLMALSAAANAQLVDAILGQKRSLVSVLMRPYRIVDYKLERVVHTAGDGIHQTVFYKNDTCNKFYWAVPTDVIPEFTAKLTDAGYKPTAENGFVKDSLELIVRPLESGTATLFIAVLSTEMKEMQAAAQKQKRKKQQTQRPKASVPSQVELEAMPLLQQAILAEEADTTPKPPKNPQRHWVGEREGKTSILGWDK
jgi:hypothetical protein